MVYYIVLTDRTPYRPPGCGPGNPDHTGLGTPSRALTAALRVMPGALQRRRRPFPGGG